MMDVIAIFDIGKTNKKVLLFDKDLKVVFQEEQCFAEILDDDEFPCDDIAKIETWMHKTIHDLTESSEYNVKAVNFTTYGASLAYLDENGQRLTPVYNYLKPMFSDILEDFYENYGGVEEFSRKTASPPSGMLNSGLQILWLRKKKPDIYAKVKDFLHFPQYLSYCFTKEKTSEYTYLGCHSSLWDFDKMNYHQWLSDYGIKFPDPRPNDTTFSVNINKKSILAGIGIHDSSASLVPYLMVNPQPFVLISTGTWCISMNPFNDEPLTKEQLLQDALCYLSVNQKPVKSSRLFLGHIHQVNAKTISDFFGVEESFYKKVKTDGELLHSYLCSESVFFKNGVPEKYVDTSVNLKTFRSASDAYHQLMIDLTRLAFNSLKLVLSSKDETKSIYISGGFARNDIFVRLIATMLPDKKVYTTEIDNSTALGAALTIWEKGFGNKAPLADLGLKEIYPL